MPTIALILLLAAAPSPGARASGDGWSVELLVPGPPPRPGGKGTARVVVAARGTFHVNRDYPMSFRPDPAATAGLAGARIALGEGAERTPCPGAPGESCTVAAPLPFVAAPSGETRIAGTVSFSVCDADRCLIERVPLALRVR